MPVNLIMGNMKYKDSQGQYQDITGLRGDQGPRGETGPQGPTGEKGDRGDPGEESVMVATQVTGNQYRLGLGRE